MPNQHEHTARTFRPAAIDEYEPAQAALDGSEIDMNRFLRACLRWLVADPAVALATIEPHLPALAIKGRPKVPARSDGRSGVGAAEKRIGPPKPARSS